MTVYEVETNPSDFEDFSALLALLSDSFADMAGRIDPPSSLSRLGVADLRRKVREEDLFLIRRGARPLGCLFGRVRGDVYYLGKLAVAAPQRRQGLGRALVAAAGRHARARGIAMLELETRVELFENHAAFAAMGFVEVGRTAHPGYDRPTSVTMRMPL